MKNVKKLTPVEIKKYKEYWENIFNVELLEKFKLIKSAYKQCKLN